jgi:hypothetical protein
MALSSCVEPAGYWAKVCEARMAGEDLPAAGKAPFERAVILSIDGTAVMWPDMERYPRCAVPVALEFSDDVELDAFDRLRSEATEPFPPVSMSGRGEWKQIRRGHLGGPMEHGFAIVAPKVHGAAEITDEARKAFGPS